MRKLYYAKVTMDMSEYFREGIEKHKDEIKIIREIKFLDEDFQEYMYYELEAEEGIINPSWELNK